MGWALVCCTSRGGTLWVVDIVGEHWWCRVWEAGGGVLRWVVVIVMQQIQHLRQWADPIDDGMLWLVCCGPGLALGFLPSGIESLKT